MSATDDITACCKSNRVTVITNTDIIVSNYMTYAACLVSIKKQSKNSLWQGNRSYYEIDMGTGFFVVFSSNNFSNLG